MFKAYGNAVSEIFRDPELKEKTREFSRSASESVKTLRSKFKDEDVRDKFREVGEVAQDFGKDVKDTFKNDKVKRKENK